MQGRGGGERVLQVFEEQLPNAMNSQPFQQLLSIQSVKRIIQESDGYQPFLVAPENGYRALVREGVKLMESPSAAAVDAVDMVLRDIGQKVRRFPCHSVLFAAFVHLVPYIFLLCPSFHQLYLTLLDSGLVRPPIFCAAKMHAVCVCLACLAVVLVKVVMYVTWFPALHRNAKQIHLANW